RKTIPRRFGSAQPQDSGVASPAAQRPLSKRETREVTTFPPESCRGSLSMPDETEPTEPNEPTEPSGPSDLGASSTPAYAANEKIAKINVADEIKNSFLDYSMSVIISRALPDVRDGLKPSQRRILYAMEQLSLFPGRKHMKCAKICGQTSGDYHPHGEAVIYP